MKRYLPVLVLLISLGIALCLAQTDQPTIKEDFQPSTLNQPGQEYPQVNSQGYARFRIAAPQAQSVSVNLGGRGGTPLKKSDDGVKIQLQGDKAVATLRWHSVQSDLLTSAPKVTEYGRERTELVKQDGRWLISKRVILSEGGMPEGLLKSYPKQ